jgi:hypothetical protein
MPIPKSILCLTYLLLQNLGNFVASSPLPGETSDVDNDNCVTTEEECIHYASTAGPGVSWSGVVSSFDLPSGCIRIWIENSDDQVWLNTNEFGAGSVDGVSPVCQCKSFCKMTSFAPVPDLYPINSTAHRQKLHQIIAGCLI